MNRPKILSIVAGCLLFLITFGVSWYAFSDIVPLKKIFAEADAVEGVVYRPIINQSTKIYQEVAYLCGNKAKIRVPTGSLMGFSYEALRKKYPVHKGWMIDDSVPNVLFLTRIEGDFCPQHRDYRHLGIRDGYLAIFQGPMGVDEVLIQKEDLQVKRLPVELQQRLQQATKFKSVSQTEQILLRDNLEFYDSESLNAFLDGLDEFEQ
ncbi:MAG: BofC C-terminal domain-containing protein [Thermincolia bacterium]